MMIPAVIICILLLIAYKFLGKKYQWPLDCFLRYILLTGLVFFVLTFVCIMSLTAIYDSPQGPLVIEIYGPLFFAAGEFAGFALFLWVLRQNKISNKGV